jgi:plastocyanin
MRLPVSRLVLALLVAALAGGAACDRNKDTGGAVTPPSTTAPNAAEGTVIIQNLSFNPDRVTAKVGQEVVWSYRDNGLNHTVSADDGSFDSGRRGDGDFRRAFAKPGAYAYHCNVHARMKGTVVIRP